MTIQDLQPIIFNESNANCDCNSNTTLIVQDNDITQFQFKLNVCSLVPNLITNGQLTTTDGWQSDGFSFGNNGASSNSGFDSTLETSTNILGIGYSYEIGLTIDKNQGVPALLYLGTQKIAEFTTSGYHTFYGECDSNSTTDKLRLVSPNGNEIVVSEVSCFMLEKKFALFLMDLNNNILWTRTLADDIADANYTFFRIDRNTVTVSFSWDWVTDETNGLNYDYGCYKLGISSICENTDGQFGVLDPYFYLPITLDEYSYPWQVQNNSNATISITDNKLTYAGSFAAVATATVEEQNTAPTALSVKYQCQLIIDSIGSAEVVVSIGGTNSATYTTSGTKNFTITTNAAPTALRIKITDTLLGAPGDVVISKFDCYAVYNDEFLGNTQMTADEISNVFDFKQEHACSILLTATNNEDAYGLNFESAFYLPRVRMKGSLRANSFESEVETLVNMFEIKRITYGEQKKQSIIRLQDVPEYVVNWLSLFRIFNNVYVDTVDYIVVEDIDILYNRFCDTAKVGIIVERPRQDLVNRNTKGILAVSDVNNYLVRLTDESELITFIDKEEIELKG